MNARDGSGAAELLKISLACAVPLWIERVRHLGFDERQRQAEACAQIIAEKGDIILFRSKKKGATAEAFNKLAEGLACLAFQPGGVKFLGLHFEVKED